MLLRHFNFIDNHFGIFNACVKADFGHNLSITSIFPVHNCFTHYYSLYYWLYEDEREKAFRKLYMLFIGPEIILKLCW